MPVTLQEIAEQLNLSKGTVSRVLNRRNDDMISEATRNRVVAAATTLGYYPNRAARSLATGRTQSVAFFTHELDAISSSVVNRMQRLVRERALDMIVNTFDRHVNSTIEKVSSAWQADGVLAYEPHEYIHLIYDAPSGAHPPMVSMGTYLIAETDFVGTNLIPELDAAVRHLIEQGCRRIAYVEDAAERVPPDFRHETYRLAMAAAGMPDEYIAVPGGTRANARAHIREYVATVGHPDGILCRYDDLAIGVYRGLRDIGLRIPADVALIGCDGIEDTEYLDPPLTTIVQPVQQMCDVAWDLLEHRMNSPRDPLRHITVPSRLDIRGSSLR